MVVFSNYILVLCLPISLSNVRFINVVYLFLDNLTSCCQAKKVPGSCLGHCIVDYSNGYRKLSKDEEKTMDMGLCKDHAKAIKECQKRGISSVCSFKFYLTNLYKIKYLYDH